MIAGGEPTVAVRHEGGRGGRCSELTLRFARLMANDRDSELFALFSSSDGVDGTSGASGFILTPESPGNLTKLGTDVDEALSRSDTASVVDDVARVLPRNPTGNNLRDFFLVIRPALKPDQRRS